MRNLFLGFAVLAFGSLAAQASTVNVSVDAFGDSTNLEGTALGGETGILLEAGDKLRISATGEVELATQGINLPLSGPDGNLFYSTCLNGWACGSLVGQIGPSGDYFLVGSNFSGLVATSGELFLRVLDTDFLNNAGNFNAEVKVTTPIPLPAGALLLFTGMLTLGLRSMRGHEVT